MMRRTALVAALALLAHAALGPSGAFDLTSYSRSASVSIVSDASGYTSITMNGCTLLGVTGGTCTFTVTNKGTTAQFYNLTEAPNGAEVVRYKMDNSAWETTSRAMTPNPIGVGSSATATAEIGQCLGCGTKNAYFTIEGEKAGKLNSIETRIKMTIVFT